MHARGWAGINISQADCVPSSLHPLDRAPSALTLLLAARTALFSSLPRVTRTVTEHVCTSNTLEGTELAEARQKPSLHQKSCVHRFSQRLTTGTLRPDAPCCQPSMSEVPPACKWMLLLGGDPRLVFRPGGDMGNRMKTVPGGF